MKLRSLPVAVAAAAAVLITTSGLVPAYADVPADPVFTNLDSSTAGHLTGTISSPGFPEIYIRFSNASGVVYQHKTLNGDSDTFDIPTWGYAGLTNIYAYTCLTTDQNSGECSAETVVGTFTPTDVTVSPTWSSDLTIGPGDAVSVDMVDDGGGSLYAQWTDDNPAADPARVLLAHNGSQDTAIADGTGQEHVYRCDSDNTDQCVELASGISPTYTVKQNATASIGAVTGVSSASPTTTFDVTTTGAGTGTGSYTVAWHLESVSAPGTPIDGYGASPTGSLVSGVAQDVPLDATNLPAGDYNIVGTITVVDTDYGTYTALPMTGGTLHSSGDISPPVLTSITASPTKIYPLISGNSTYKSTATITVTGVGAPDTTLLSIYQKSTGNLVRARSLSHVDATHATTTWNGRRLTGEAVPAGTYLLKVQDAASNVSTTVGSISVSGHKLVTKTWTHTYSPAGTLADKYVGKCSTLRKPSLRGWYNSLGYYANTKCSSQTSKDSLISTLHAVFLPTSGVVSYTDIHVNTYGGAARGKPGSKAVIRYLTTSGGWSSDRTLSSTLATHSGYTKSTSGLVFKDHSFGWGFYTGFGYQYDVKSFTVVLHYKALG